jgi:hypothetical protein
VLVLHGFSSTLIHAVTRCSGRNCSRIDHGDLPVIRRRPSGRSKKREADLPALPRPSRGWRVHRPLPANRGVSPGRSQLRSAIRECAPQGPIERAQRPRDRGAVHRVPQAARAQNRWSVRSHRQRLHATRAARRARTTAPCDGAGGDPGRASRRYQLKQRFGRMLSGTIVHASYRAISARTRIIG